MFTYELWILFVYVSLDKGETKALNFCNRSALIKHIFVLIHLRNYVQTRFSDFKSMHTLIMVR